MPPDPLSAQSEAFGKALKANVVVEGVERQGPLTVAEMLAAREWFDKRRADQRALDQIHSGTED